MTRDVVRLIVVILRLRMDGLKRKREREEKEEDEGEQIDNASVVGGTPLGKSLSVRSAFVEKSTQQRKTTGRQQKRKNKMHCALLALGVQHCVNTAMVIRTTKHEWTQGAPRLPCCAVRDQP